MIERIFKSIAFASLFVFVCSIILIMGVMYTHFTNVQRTQLKGQAELVAQGLDHAEHKYFDDLKVEGYRITWISEKGKVKYDSANKENKMENHLEREEVKEALKNGTGESTRYSTTMMERQLYVAEKLSDGTVVRLSTTQQTVLGLLVGLLNPLIIVIVLSLGLSLFLAYRLSKRIIKPLNEMDIDGGEVPYKELAPLVARIRSQKERIRSQKEALRQREKEFETTILNMSEGVLLINSDGYIVSVNASAKRIFDMDEYPEGKHIFDYLDTYEMRNMLQEAESGDHSEIRVPVGDIDYELHASPIYNGGKVSAISVIVFDITEQEKAEIARREFTANVTHELKTPLQTISGSAELLANGMVKEQDVRDFGGKIYSESKRMINLIDDIIDLSHLEEDGNDLRKEETDLYGIAEKTVVNMTQTAERFNIDLELTGRSVMLKGVPHLLGSMVFNLVDNAIKYGREGGKVTVNVSKEGNEAVLTVSDDGIGIPDDEKERIFERFYRVDKSRSKEVGGTGLGLSIVKHAALIHNAEVSLESVLGKGTKIKVAFPLENVR